MHSLLPKDNPDIMQCGSCYVGLSTDPRRDPVRLTPNSSMREAFNTRDELRQEHPACEVFEDASTREGQ